MGWGTEEEGLKGRRYKRVADTTGISFSVRYYRVEWSGVWWGGVEWSGVEWRPRKVGRLFVRKK